MKSSSQFLPMSLREAKEQGIDEFDIILISGDAYVDHPSFGTAIMGRVLHNAGYSVGVIAQPDWKGEDDFKRLGQPRLFFGISSGNVDSMVNNYTPNLKRRKRDVYSPGGKQLRPDRAVIVYSNKIHSLFHQTPIVLGGIEASLRRFAHYDYWSDSVRQSVLADAPADVIVFGMGERQIVEIARRLDEGKNIQEIEDVPGTAIKMELRQWRNSEQGHCLQIPSFQEVSKDKTRYAKAFQLHYKEQDPFHGRTVIQVHPKTVIVQNKPALPLSSLELDGIYELPYSKQAHPFYKEKIPALEPVKFSITSHRGCFGSCSFCALTHHQGRIVQSRSLESIIEEAKRLTEMSDFKGVIQDVGGPTANMYGLNCTRWKSKGACEDKFCSPNCPHLDTNHQAQLELLQKLREIPGVKKVFISSGIRYDLLLEDSSDYMIQLCQHHVSGHLKVAPEHITNHVTNLMHKPPIEMWNQFRKKFQEHKRNIGKEQYILPYFMSGHPGCTVKDMVELAEYIRDNNMYTEQVQDFTPTPMSASTCMYYTGLNPFTMEKVHVPKGREKLIQRAILHYKNKRNWGLIREGLKTVGRDDLIGTGNKCLIPPSKGEKGQNRRKNKRSG